MWIIAIIALFLPRVTIVFLYFLTGWFNDIFQTWLWPLIGFIFAPYTLLWYSVVMNWYGGRWNTLQLSILALAVIMDISASGRGWRG